MQAQTNQTMVEVEFLDTPWMQFTSHLPDSVRRIGINFSPHSIFGRNGFPSTALTALLKSAPTKLRQITIQRVRDPLSPEDLELLTTAISKSESITIQEWYSDVAYSCLESCLSQVDGVKEIECNMSFFGGLISNNQAERLFEGVKTSSCIESLCFDKNGSRSWCFQDSQYAANGLLETLQINRSLQRLSLCSLRLETDGILSRIFQAAISDTGVQSLSIGVDGSSPFRHIPWNVWTNVLCQEDCSVEELNLCDNIEITGPQDNPTVSHNDARRNTSVTDMSFFKSSLDMTRIMQICSLFQSLVSLRLPNNISDLSPLDPLLIGENGLTLQNLYLMFNTQVSGEHVSEFFRKLPQMTCIRKIDLRLVTRLFGWGEWMSVLEDAILQNKSLECLLLSSNYNNPDYFSRIEVGLAMNRGGRPRVRTLTENVMPLVLERAAKLSYCDTRKRDRKTSLRVDVVFGLLQEMVSLSLLGR